MRRAPSVDFERHTRANSANTNSYNFTTTLSGVAQLPTKNNTTHEQHSLLKPISVRKFGRFATAKIRPDQAKISARGEFARGPGTWAAVRSTLSSVAHGGTQRARSARHPWPQDHKALTVGSSAVQVIDAGGHRAILIIAVVYGTCDRVCRRATCTAPVCVPGATIPRRRARGLRNDSKKCGCGDCPGSTPAIAEAKPLSVLGVSEVGGRT